MDSKLLLSTKFSLICLLIFSLCSFASTLSGQVKVAQDADLATPADPSAALDVYSLNKGLLPPRMTMTQRNAITAPANGLMIYNTTENCLNEYLGGVWKTYCDLRFSTSCNCVEYLKDNGLPTQVWIPISSEDWRILGNTGTNPTTNFLGTRDNQAISIRTNNIQKWRFETNGTLSFTNTGNSVFIGALSGINDDLSSNNNTFVGASTGTNNTTGHLNTAVGYNSFRNNVTGWRNTSVGVNTLTGNTGGNFNVAMGYDALRGNLTGTSNVAIGNICMTMNTSGSDNVAVGAQALRNLTSGNYNVAVGRAALAANANGGGMPASFSNVVGIGYFTYTDKTAGDHSVAIGTRACHQETTGHHNTGVGGYSIQNNETGAYNSALGYLAGGFSSITSNFSNTSSIGYSTVVNASNKVRLGNTTVTVVEGQVAYSWPSDGRFKSNIKENVPGLDFVMGLRPVTYQFDTKKFDEFLYREVPDSIKSQVLDVQDYTASQQATHTGFVAQEIETLVNELGYDFGGLNVPQSDNENYSVSYSTFVVPLVKAVQEQQTIIEEQQAHINNLKKEREAAKMKEQQFEKTIQNLIQRMDAIEKKN